jgi:hypothetical protein
LEPGTASPGAAGTSRCSATQKLAYFKETSANPSRPSAVTRMTGSGNNREAGFRPQPGPLRSAPGRPPHRRPGPRCPDRRP